MNINTETSMSPSYALYVDSPFPRFDWLVFASLFYEKILVSEIFDPINDIDMALRQDRKSIAMIQDLINHSNVVDTGYLSTKSNIISERHKSMMSKHAETLRIRLNEKCNSRQIFEEKKAIMLNEFDILIKKTERLELAGQEQDKIRNEMNAELQKLKENSAKEIMKIEDGPTSKQKVKEIFDKSVMNLDLIIFKKNVPSLLNRELFPEIEFFSDSKNQELLFPKQASRILIDTLEAIIPVNPEKITIDQILEFRQRQAEAFTKERFLEEVENEFRNLVDTSSEESYRKSLKKCQEIMARKLELLKSNYKAAKIETYKEIFGVASTSATPAILLDILSKGLNTTFISSAWIFTVLGISAMKVFHAKEKSELEIADSKWAYLFYLDKSFSDSTNKIQIL
jgi:hypothetical protein